MICLHSLNDGGKGWTKSPTVFFFNLIFTFTQCKLIIRNIFLLSYFLLSLTCPHLFWKNLLAWAIYHPHTKYFLKDLQLWYSIFQMQDRTLFIQKNQNFGRIKNCQEISSFYTSTKNDDHMLHCSWDIMHDGCNSYFYFDLFLPFYPHPLATQNIKIFKKWKNT